MNIWYIHHYGGGPGLGRHDRPYQLAKAWLEQGHVPTIFTANVHHLLQAPAPLDPSFSIDGVPYFTIKARPYTGNGWNRVLNILDFTRGLYGIGDDLPSPDLIIASSPHPFAIFPAERLARKYQAKLAFEFRDIWPLSITQILGTSPWHPFVLACAAAEKFALGKADFLASVLPRGDRYLADRGYATKPYIWVPNGIGITEPPVEPESVEGRKAYELAGKWHAEGRMVIAYAGALGKPNAIDALINAVAFGQTAHGEKNVRLLILGDGEQAKALRAMSGALDPNTFHFSGSLPKREIAAILQLADIGYAGVRNHGGLYKYGVSLNKFADYFRASLPIALPIEPCGDPVSVSRGGVVRGADSPAAVWELLNELVVLTRSERQAMGQRGLDYMNREYRYETAARRYIEAAS